MTFQLGQTAVHNDYNVHTVSAVSACSKRMER